MATGLSTSISVTQKSVNSCLFKRVLIGSSTSPPTKLQSAIQDFNNALEKRQIRDDVKKHLPLQNQISVDQVLAVGRDVAYDWQLKKDDKSLVKVNKFLKSLQAYGPIIEVFIRPVPAVKSLVWGGIKLVLSVRYLILPYMLLQARVLTCGSD